MIKCDLFQCMNVITNILRILKSCEAFRFSHNTLEAITVKPETERMIAMYKTGKADVI